MDEELEDKFNKIKDELGLNSNAEVVRFLVNRFYKELLKKGGLISVFFLKVFDGANPPTISVLDFFDVAMLI